MREAATRLLLIFVLTVIGLKGRAAQPVHGLPDDPGLQISQYIRRIFQDSKGNLWFGTNGDGVARHDGKTLTYFSQREGFCADTVRAMLEDSNRNIWFATSGGVCRYDGTSFASITQRDGLDSNQVWCILLDKKGTLWFGTEGGVNAYDGRRVTSFALPSLSSNEVPVKAAYLAPKLVNWILEDREGNLWFCTNGKGVFRYDGKSVTGFSKVDGLCDDFVQTAYEDKAGNLWFGSRWRISQAERIFYQYHQGRTVGVKSDAIVHTMSVASARRRGLSCRLLRLPRFGGWQRGDDRTQQCVDRLRRAKHARDIRVEHDRHRFVREA